ncbi:tRNA-binding protein [Picrophilus oshimae]|uniref:Protein secretion chaperonin CsaA n=1 Tax=Picrophilus torridus (strain ATCC 700027 / DSM 9790 / JCM 10055 / NBRC 100828 / KAW 2/3) TaxID=1122961 RepID=Q6L208_PICTO|nr:tRNA-binding protein [Picrophilus oshimae]AAT42994.1 protein secretion chaperonin CsaA [Picrophilus oshimae DSM 9789]5ZDI_A Chain A, Protein secretion chaperonin CsaA [Picrophilus oshimae DSM 9789]5ZDI_B Chain B, Protein secretion chaperonin CsaA [Picrophilus oshimae DSM 9789]SMD30704.1 tRNA-binding protein [Picrophilus oshimae DSM 9789]
MITYNDFSKIDIRVGIIKEVSDFKEAIKPAYKLKIYFGDIIGYKNSSAQITNYKKDELINKKIIAVVNFPPKQIANFISEVLVLGAITGDGVKLLTPDGGEPGDKIA